MVNLLLTRLTNNEEATKELKKNMTNLENNLKNNEEVSKNTLKQISQDIKNQMKDVKSEISEVKASIGTSTASSAASIDRILNKMMEMFEEVFKRLPDACESRGGGNTSVHLDQGNMPQNY